MQTQNAQSPDVEEWSKTVTKKEVKNDVKKSQQEQLFDNAYSNASARLSEPNSSINTDRASRIKNNDFSKGVHRKK